MRGINEYEYLKVLINHDDEDSVTDLFKSVTATEAKIANIINTLVNTDIISESCIFLKT